LEGLCFYKSFVSNFEFWRKDLVLVHGFLIVFLRLLNIDPELAMEFSEVSDQFLSFQRSKFLFEMNSKSWIVTLVSKEW
jgi:hypothetical protein